LAFKLALVTSVAIMRGAAASELFLLVLVPVKCDARTGIKRLILA
jgi:hypothetical protein